MRHIPVDRHKGGRSFATALRALRAGEIVGVFPEATISRSFELKEFKSGAAKVAQEAGVPVLPTTIWGSQRVWTKGQPKRMAGVTDPGAHLGGRASRDRPARRRHRGDRADEGAMQAQLEQQQAAYPVLDGEDLRYVPARLGGTAPTPEEAHAADLHDMTRTEDKFNT